MNLLAKSWHRENDTDDEVHLLILQQRDCHVASVHETGGDEPVCEEPKTPFHVMNAVGTTLITSGKLLNNTQKAKAEEISVIRELGVWEVTDGPYDEVVFGTRWVDINKGDETTPFYRSRSCKSMSVKQTGHFSQLHLESLRRLLICATIDELPNEMVQSVAWTEPVVLMLIDVRRAHFCSAARRKVFVELPADAGAGKSKVGRLLKSMYGCRDAVVTWEFAICKVIVAIGLVQGRAPPCIYRHMEKQLRVWVHGDDFVLLGYIVNVRWFFLKLRGGESRNSWTPWIPRLCTKHPSAWQAHGMDC